ncbi:MAG: hypothetical protein K1X85_11080 [Ignavibacteria bacterium]|nr:hypothetical protein [Ignavibacteria bacterium]
MSAQLSLAREHRIRCLVADREFGSGKMFKYLKKEGINFHIRIRRTSAIRYCMSAVSSPEEAFEKIRAICDPAKQKADIR